MWGRREREKREKEGLFGEEWGRKRESRESDMVWWVYAILYMCHLISGELVVLDVLHWR